MIEIYNIWFHYTFLLQNIERKETLNAQKEY